VTTAAIFSVADRVLEVTYVMPQEVAFFALQQLDVHQREENVELYSMAASKKLVGPVQTMKIATTQESVNLSLWELRIKSVHGGILLLLSFFQLEEESFWFSVCAVRLSLPPKEKDPR
jgi:hypothetical protein